MAIADYLEKIMAIAAKDQLPLTELAGSGAPST